MNTVRNAIGAGDRAVKATARMRRNAALQAVLLMSSSGSAYAMGPAFSGSMAPAGGSSPWAGNTVNGMAGAGHAAAAVTLHNQNFGGNAGVASFQSAAISSLTNPHLGSVAGQSFHAANNAALLHHGAGAMANNMRMASSFSLPQTTFATANGNFKLGGQGLSLDLTSSVADVILGSNLFRTTSHVTIDVGGVSQTFTPGQRVTAGEYLAIKEALGGAAQTIQLTSNGVASGGEFNLNLVGARTGLLVVPTGVTAIDYVSSSKTFAIAGDLVNYGSIYAVSTNPAVTAGSIFGQNVTNESGAVISSVLPASLSALAAGNTGNIDLTVGARSVLANTGTVSSSGNLNLLSGAGTFINGGLLSSTAGNVNFSAPKAVDITINGQGGTVQALAGDINVRSASYQGAANVTMNGGDYLSNNLNVNSGSGAIAGSIGQVSGVLNTNAGATHLAADTTTLYLGSNSASGDPTYASTGDIVITGAVTAGEAITILAGGNITASGDASISTTQDKGAGSDITLVAGGNVTTTGTTTGTLPGSPIGTGTATVDFSSGGGGNIDLSGSTHAGAVISTASNDSNAGNVILAAVANGSVGGQVILPGGGTSGLNGSSRSIDASAPAGNGGNVTIIAGASPATSATTVNIGGSIQSSGGGTFKSGDITIVTGNPTASTGTTVTYDPDGSVHSGSATIVSGTNYAANAKVVTADLISAAGGGTSSTDGGTGGAVTVLAGGGITTGQILSFGGGGGGGSLSGILFGGNGGDGGAVTLQGDRSGTPSAFVTVNGQINSAGGGGGGALATTASTGGLGGEVNVSASGPVAITGQIYSGAGGDGGTDGGNQATGGGGGGSFGGGGGGAGAGGLLTLIVNAASGGGGAGLFGGGGGGTDLLLGVEALGGGGGGIFGLGTGGIGASIDGHIGGINLGGLGVGVGLLNGSSQGGLAAGLAGLAGAVLNAVTALAGLNVPGLSGAAPSASNANITITGGGITLGGNVYGKNVSLTSIGSAGAIDLTHDVTGTQTINLTAHGTGDISDIGGSLFTPTLVATTDNASIGSAANPVMTNAASITANAGGAGSNVYINDSGSVALVGDNTAGTAGPKGVFSLTAAGDITAGAAETLKADTVNLTATGTGASGASDIGAAGTPLLLTASTLTANAPGDVNIVNDATGTVNLGASSAGATSGTFALEATNADGLNTTGDVSGHTVILTVDNPGTGITVGGKITGTSNGTVTLNSGGGIMDGIGAGAISGGTLNLTADNGDIGSSATPLNVAGSSIGANASGNVYLSNTGAVDLQASSAGSGDTFSVVTKADGNGNGGITVSGDIASTAGAPIGQILLNSTESGKGTGGIQEGATTQGTLVAANVSLSDGAGGAGKGDIGSANAPLQVDTSGLDATTKGAVFIDNANKGNLDLGNITGSGITISSAGNVTTTKDITTPGGFDLTATGLTNDNTITAGTVHVTGAAGSDLDVQNGGTIVATTGNITIDSAGGKNLSLGDDGASTPGTLQVSGTGEIVLNANGTSTDKNGIDFVGSQNLNTDPAGESVINANAGANQHVDVEDGVTITGNNTVLVNTSILNLNGTGSLIGNPLILNGGALGTTIANSTGDVTLNHDLIFEGQSLAIVSRGNITSTANITIDLSNADSTINGGNGGSLNLIAGYDFTPTGNGIGTSSKPYTITEPSVTGGSINLSTVTIKTGSSVADGNGGNVTAIAHSGSNLGGSINLGTIDTSANGIGSTTSTGGNVLIIGQGITVGNINTTSVNGGTVTIASATPMTNGTVQIANGNVSSGSFSATAGTYNGNIVIGGINTGNANVSVVTGGIGSVSGTDAKNPIIGNILTLGAGTGGAGTAANPIYTTVTQLTANALSPGGVFVSNSSAALTLTGNNSGQTFSIVNTTPATLTVDNNIDTMNLILSDKGGTIVLPSSNLTVNSDTVTGNGGTIFLEANTITSPNVATQPFIFNANASNTGTQNNGGSITVLTNNASTSTIGNGPGDFEFLASGNGQAGAAKFANDGGNVLVDAANGIKINGGPNSNGATYFIEGLMVGKLGGGTFVLSADGNGTGDGGSITVNQLGTSSVLVSSAPGADFDFTARGTNGGTIHFLTGGDLTVDMSGLQYAPTSINGNGGNVFLTANTLKSATPNPNGPFILDASANPLGTGSGGSAGISLTKANTSVTVGTLAGQYELIASSGKKGGNGGAATFINAGDLTVIPTGIKVAPLSANGNGGSITLEAGHGAGTGNLLVTKALSASGKGKGNGGNISLTTDGGTFIVGGTAASTVAGVIGTLTVAGKVKGNVVINNINGNISLNNSLAAVNNAAITAGGNGNILLGSTIGTATGLTPSNEIDLTAGGSITSKNAGNVAAGKNVVINAGVPNLFGGTVTPGVGAAVGTDKIAFVVNAQKLTVNAPGLVNLSNRGSADLTLNASNGGTSFALTTLGNLILTGDVNGGAALSLKSGAGKSITAQSTDDVLTGQALTLTGGTLGLGTASVPLTFNATSLVANSGTGAANLASIGTSPLSFNGSKNSKALTLTAAGDLLLNGVIGTSAATINLTTTGKGNILQGGAVGADVVGKFVNLTSAGTIGTDAIGQTAANAVIVKANNLTANAPNGLINIANQLTSVSTLTTATGSKITYTTKGPTNLGNLTATAGDIIVNDTKGLLQTLPNDQILATNGKISLNASDKNGTITLGGNSKITTAGPNGGDVLVFIGATPITGNATKPAGVTEIITPGNTINYGVNGITLAKDATATIKAEAANVIISTGTARATAIKVNSGVFITADPPTDLAPTVNAATVGGVAILRGPVAGNVEQVLNGVVSGAVLSGTASTTGTSGNSLIQTVSGTKATDSNLLSTSLSSALRQSTDTRALSWMQETAWISDTELASGEIPAVVSAGGNLGIKPTVTVVSDLRDLSEEELAGDILAASAKEPDEDVLTAGKPLQGGVSVAVEAGKKAPRKSQALNRGSVLFAPEVDTLVKTPFGDLAIGAHSVVLVLAFEGGIGIYDLDDCRGGAVSLSSGGRSIALRPGFGTVVSAGQAASFEQVNPAQLFAYRGIKSATGLNVGGREMKVFTSEFSVLQAISTVQPLRLMVASRDSRAQRLTNHMLKTAGILMQLTGGNTQYKQVLRPKVVASL